MNNLDREIEQQVREHYAQALGNAPVYSDIVARLPKQLPTQSRTDKQTTQRMPLFFLVSWGTNKKQPKLRRGLLIACSFLLALTLITGTAYATNSSALKTAFDFWFNKQTINKFVDINQKQTIGNAEISVLQAYADEKSIHIIYDIKYPNLTDQQKLPVRKSPLKQSFQLKQVGGMSFEANFGFLPPKVENYTRPIMMTFDASKLQKDQKNLKLQFSVSLEFAEDQGNEKGTATFEFEIPRHTGSLIE